MSGQISTVALPAQRTAGHLRWIALLWLIATVSFVGLAIDNGAPGWDMQVYENAIQSVHRGGDPYAEGIAVQRAFHNLPSPDPHIHPPMTYVYSPQTLPLLGLLARVPGWLLGPFYCFLILAGFLLQLWACYQMASPQERRWLVYLLPFVAFFPGLLNEDVILSANIVYFFYGLILTAAVAGWKQNKWFWYYLAVIAASICKAPLLSLLAFPVLVGRKQWLSAGITAAVGLLFFASQPYLWPEKFHEYLLAVQLQFDWNHDFGFGPAGLLGKVLWDMKQPYSSATTALYLGFAAVISILLLVVRHFVLHRHLSREMWVPVALVGTVLLNPRIKEYDLHAVTVPLILIAWRTLRWLMDMATQWRAQKPVHFSYSLEMNIADEEHSRNRPDLALALSALGWFVAFNMIAGEGGDVWKQTAFSIMLFFFLTGTLLVLRSANKIPPAYQQPEIP